MARQFSACAIDAGIVELLGSINQGIMARFADLDRKLDVLMHQQKGLLLPPDKDAADKANGKSKRAAAAARASPPLHQAWLSDERSITPQVSGRSRGNQPSVVQEESTRIVCAGDLLSVMPCGGDEVIRTPTNRSAQSWDEEQDSTWASTRDIVLPPGQRPDPTLQEAPVGENPTMLDTFGTFTSSTSNLDQMPKGAVLRRRRSSNASQFSHLMLLIRTSRLGVRQKIWHFMEDPESSRAAMWFYRIWDPFILCTIGVTALQTITPQPINGTTAVSLEMAFDIVFTLEVLLRFLGSPSKCLFVRNFHNVTDFIAAVPPLVVRAYLGFDPPARDTLSNTNPHNLLLSLVPMVRVMKTLRRFHQFHLFVVFLESIVEALRVLLFTLLILVLSVSALIYLVEPRSNIDSLPQAMWLTIVTVTTVGYGDVTPETTVGHFVVALLILSSVLYMAMPIGIIGNAFTQIWQDRDRLMLMMKTRDRLIQWGYTARDMIKLFKHFNTDGDGNMSIVEFKLMMHEMQIGLSDERVVDLFNSIDKDASGGIDDKEFILGLFPSAYHDIYGVKHKDAPEDTGSRRSSRAGPEVKVIEHTDSHVSSGQRNMRLPPSHSSDKLTVFRRAMRSASNTSKSSRADMIISRTSSHMRPPSQQQSFGNEQVNHCSSASSSHHLDLDESQASAIPEGHRAADQACRATDLERRAADLERLLLASQADLMPGQSSALIPEYRLDLPSSVAE